MLRGTYNGFLLLAGEKTAALRCDTLSKSHVAYNWVELHHRPRSRIPELELLTAGHIDSPSAVSPPPGDKRKQIITCIYFLPLHNKSLKTQWLRTTFIYYLIVL